MRGVTIEVAASLVTETCCRSDCGILFAVPADWQQRRRRDHTNFYCPNGHSQVYAAKSEEEKLRDELASKERSLRWESDRRKRAEESAMNLARSRSALRGQVTKLKNKAKAGECAFCHEQFANVAAHVQAEHPGVSTDATEEDERDDSESGETGKDGWH